MFFLKIVVRLVHGLLWISVLVLAIQCSLYTDMGDSESKPETPIFQHQHFFKSLVTDPAN